MKDLKGIVSIDNKKKFTIEPKSLKANLKKDLNCISGFTQRCEGKLVSENGIKISFKDAKLVISDYKDYEELNLKIENLGELKIRR